jgi:hypothetical protein
MLVLSEPVTAKSSEAAGQEVLYIVTQGDTLFALQRSYFTSYAALRQVQRLNGIADPRRIPAGKVLRIPRALLRDETSQARVEAFSGQVILRTGTQSRLASVGERLDEGTEIECGRNSFITLRLADDSALAIPSQSTLRITRLRKVILTGALERQIDLRAGRMRAKVTPMTNPGSNFRVVTPVAVSAVRGTEFRAVYDGDTAFSAAEVDEGKVAFDGSPGSAQLELPGGFGAADVKGQSTGAVKLLAPPSLLQPDKVQSEADLRFAVSPIAGATQYRMQIARDAGFLESIGESVSKQPEFSLPGVASDSYFLRISGYDAYGLEGLSRAYTFERRLNTVTGGIDAGAPGERRLRFKWSASVDGSPQYRFQLVRKGQPDMPVVDEAGLQENLLTVSNLPPGDYEWRVASTLLIKGKSYVTWTAPQAFHIEKTKS